MLGGLAADQARSRRCSQPRGDALDHFGGHVDVEPLADVVIEEEQRLGALDQNVVDAHRHQVDADRVVLAEREGQLELGADAVGAGDQHRLAKALGQLDQRAEAADALPALRAAASVWRSGLMFSTSCVAGVDVDAGLEVRQRAAGRWHGKVGLSRRVARGKVSDFSGNGLFADFTVNDSWQPAARRCSDVSSSKVIVVAPARRLRLHHYVWVARNRARGCRIAALARTDPHSVSHRRHAGLRRQAGCELDGKKRVPRTVGALLVMLVALVLVLALLVLAPLVQNEFSQVAKRAARACRGAECAARAVAQR